MTEKVYFEQINIIRKHIAGDRLKQAADLLDKMYAYKPVRLLWFVAKAEYVLRAEHDAEAALKILDGKFFLGGDYPGLRECMKFRTKTLKRMGRGRDAVREDYCYQKSCGKPCIALEHALLEAVENFAEDAENLEKLAALGQAFYHTADMVSYFIVCMELIHRGFLQKESADAWVYKIANYGYLDEYINTNRENIFILAMDSYLDRILEILGALLHSLGHKVFLLTSPLVFETEGRLEPENTLEISWEHQEQYSDMIIIRPAALSQDGIVYGDNRADIIDRICREESKRDSAVLLCSGNLLEQLCGKEKLRRRLGRLSPYETDIQEEKVQFGWVGSYLSYSSDIYNYNVYTDVNVEPEVDFSILIPARNSAETLRYTLETCLKQRYSGTYEIVVSDNSVGGETSIHKLCQELNNPKIRYVKTPRMLPLTKSFEFGYLQTRGAFILSIGSDDGLLPWGLETLKGILDRFPEEDIVEWERGFYAWPGFNGGQQNQFVIPRKYDERNIPVGFVSTRELLKRTAQDVQAIYELPLLYINSGFRRRYMKVLLEKTGVLWDGANQDIYTGITNCCINSRILQIFYPLTIAGMSSGSVGYLDSKKTDTESHQLKYIYQWDNCGIFVAGARERLMMSTGTDDSSLYFALSNAVEAGNLSKESADRVLSWEKAVAIAFSRLPLNWDGCDLFIHRERFISHKTGEEQAAWFDQALYKTALSPHYIDLNTWIQQKSQKSYNEGTIPGGGEVLDASKYGVHNIAEAVELFAKKILISGQENLILQ